MTRYRRAEFVSLGRSSELTVMTPVRPGMVPGEIRTYEERLKLVLTSIRERALSGVPTPIGQVPTIHFARWVIIRPEQYLRFSNVPGLHYEVPPTPGDDGDPRALPDSRVLPYEPDYVPLSPGIDEAAEPPVLPTWLLFTSNYDGDLKTYIRFFSTEVAADLDRVWSNCQGYPERGATDFDAFWDYIRRHQINTEAFYSAYPSLTTPRIHQLRVFRDAFDAFVARTRKPDGSSIDEIGALLDDFIRDHQAYTEDFPGRGGLYDETQDNRRAELRKWKR